MAAAAASAAVVTTAEAAAAAVDIDLSRQHQRNGSITVDTVDRTLCILTFKAIDHTLTSTTSHHIIAAAAEVTAAAAASAAVVVAAARTAVGTVPAITVGTPLKTASLTTYQHVIGTNAAALSALAPPPGGSYGSGSYGGSGYSSSTDVRRLLQPPMAAGSAARSQSRRSKSVSVESWPERRGSASAGGSGGRCTGVRGG